MKFEDQLRKAYREESATVTPPPEMKDKVMNQIKGRGGQMKGRKWLMVTILAAAVILPTGAYAGYTYLADSIYGSKEQIVERGGTAEGYERLEAKLQDARSQFSEEEFESFMELLKQMGQFATLHADSQGNLNPEEWSADIQEEYAALMQKLEPYAAKLEEFKEGDVPPDHQEQIAYWDDRIAKAQDILTPEDYEQFSELYKQYKAYVAIVNNGDELSQSQMDDVARLKIELEPFWEQLGLSWNQ